MIALNRSEVIKKSIRFWLLFVLLVFSTLIVAYFLVWSAQKESKAYLARLDELRRIENKQTIYLNSVQQLQKQMSNISSMEFLRESDKIDLQNYALTIKNQIGPDSAAAFSGYFTILKDHPVQMEILDTLLTSISEKSKLKARLERCSENKIRKNNPYKDRNR